MTSDAAARSRIADPGLGPLGDQLIAWAARHSPVLNTLARERLADGALDGCRVALVVHLEAKTAYLATLLADAGARVVAAGSNPGSTNDAVCAALVARGIEVHATHDAPPDVFTADLLAVADTAPEIVIDDGAELTARMVDQRPDLLPGVRGVTEQTTTGVVRLRALHAAGRLPFPAIAANDAWSKHLYDNRYGTGETAVAAILRLTDRSAAGRAVCVIGYGWVGKGIAREAAGLGARVTVVEVDPVPALEAHFDGHRVAALRDALAGVDVVVAATGGIDAVGAADLDALPDGVVLANAGHHDAEIDVPALRAASTAADQAAEPRPGVEILTLPGGRRVTLLAGGRLVNIAGGQGHPVEIMDLSFSVQALAAHHLAGAGTTLEAGVHRLPEALDREIARTKLATLGVELDAPTPAQLAFSRQWTV